jgi:hypothetical protein
MGYMIELAVGNREVDWGARTSFSPIIALYFKPVMCEWSHIATLAKMANRLWR